VAKRISRLAHSLILLRGSGLDGDENLTAARERPVVFLGNHLSFVDANAIDALLAESGFADLTERLCVIVGPKVFAEPLRRLASLCFGTIKIPQSASRASGEAVMGIRDVARLAARTLRCVRERQALGDHLLIFVEGTRSRTGGMQPVLTAVGRYIEHPGALVIPFGIWGTEELVPIGDERVHPARVRVRFGEPIEGAALRERSANRSELAESIGRSIARLLPAQYRGVYAEP
jgi:1-acyl-sn-glycerol-3-phosphate acyltransferase